MKLIFFIITTYSIFLTGAQQDTFALKDPIDQLDLERVKELVDHDTKYLNEPVKTLGSPLLYAIALHQTYPARKEQLGPIIDYLLNHENVDLDSQNSYGDNAFMLQLMYTQTPEERIKVISSFAERVHLFDPNHQNSEGATILMFARAPEEVEKICQIPLLNPLATDNEERTARQRNRRLRLKNSRLIQRFNSIRQNFLQYCHTINNIKDLIRQLENSNDEQEIQLIDQISRELGILERGLNDLLNSKNHEPAKRLKESIPAILASIQNPSPVEQALLDEEEFYKLAHERHST